MSRGLLNIEAGQFFVVYRTPIISGPYLRASPNHFDNQNHPHNFQNTSKFPKFLLRTTSIIQINHFIDENTEGNYFGPGHTASQQTLEFLNPISYSSHYCILLKTKLKFHFFHDQASSVKRHSTHYMSYSFGKCHILLWDSRYNVP